MLLVGLVLLAYTLRPEVVSDGEVRFSAVAAMLAHQPMPPIKYSLVQPVLTLPGVLAAQALGVEPQVAASYFNLVAFCVLGAVILVELARSVGASTACRSMLLLLAASMLPHHLQQYFGEVLSALLVTAGVLMAPRRPVVSTVLLGLGVANTPVLLVPAVAAAMALNRHLPAMVAGVALAAAIYVAENLVKFGSLTGSGYFSAADVGFKTVLPYSGKPGFAYPLFFGVLSILFSFGKGLVFFIPALLLYLRRDTYALLGFAGARRLALWAACAALVLVYAGWWSWYGGNFWGPRFFLILAMPAAIALAVHVGACSGGGRAAVLSVLLIASAWVGIDGVVFGQQGMDVCMTNNYQLEFLCWYVPEFSALWRPFVLSAPAKVLGEILSGPRAPYAAWQLVITAYLLGLVTVTSVKRTRTSEGSGIGPFGQSAQQDLQVKGASTGIENRAGDRVDVKFG